jgi:hypothetical protein
MGKSISSKKTQKVKETDKKFKILLDKWVEYESIISNNDSTKEKRNKLNALLKLLDNGAKFLLKSCYENNEYIRILVDKKEKTQKTEKTEE